MSAAQQADEPGVTAMTSLFELDRTRGRIRMVAPGDLDLCAAPAFSAALGELLKVGTAVDVDLSGVTFIDASGVSMLKRAAFDARANGTDMTVVGASAWIERVIRVCNAGEML